ncbi:MAG TPA: LptF/LptG family permease [Longimicrobiales bacterium]|nr:LptF/LptG family permease [Longimicrobiales bacterium]
MIRTLDRLVLATFLKLFVVVTAAVPPLFILGDFTENLDLYLDRGLTRAEIGQSYLYKLPEYLQFAFPIAALVATVFTVHTMTRHREIVAAKAGGISFHRLFAPLLAVGVVLTIAALGLSEVVPRGNRIAAQIQRAEAPSRTWRSDFVYRSESGLAWKVDRLTASDGRMTGVVLERPPGPESVGLHVVASAGGWTEGEGWLLVDGYMRRLWPDSTEHTLEFDRLRVPAMTERPEDLLEVPRAPEEMTFAEIERLAGIIERSGGDATEWLVRRGQLLSVPVATLVIILFGAPLATSSKRGGTAFGIGVSLVTVIVFTMLLKLAGALGEAGAISPWTAAWAPNIVFAATALVLLARVRT